MPQPFASFAHARLFDLEKQLETNSLDGLTHKQVLAGIKRYGKNVFNGGKESIWTLLIRQFRSVFIWLLVFASGVSFLLGEHLNAVLILGFILINVVLTFFKNTSLSIFWRR